MRFPIVALAGFFLAATLAGCGGASIPKPPAETQASPPPGTTADMLKKPDSKKGGVGPAKPAAPAKK